MSGTAIRKAAPMDVEDLLGSPVHVCGRDLPLLEAVDIMVDEDIGALGVTDSGDPDGTLIGIFTDRDVVRWVVDGRAEATVEHWMTESPDSLAPGVDVSDAINWIVASGYRHLPVVEGRKLVGLISIKDLLWAITTTEWPPQSPFL